MIEEKERDFMRTQLKRVAENTAVSRQRTMVWGGLATLLWMGAALHLPSVVQAKSAWPHLGMMVAAAFIAGTMKNNLRQANKAGQEAQRLLRQLAKPTDTACIKRDFCALYRTYPSFFVNSRE